LDQLYSRTETPDGSDAGGELPEGPSGDGFGAAGIMSALPHRRPHRRSARRHHAAPRPAPGVTGAAAAVAAQAVETVPAEPVPHLSAVADDVALPRPRRRAAGRRRTLPPPAEPAPGIARLALDGVVETAKFPWRVAAEVARQAAGSVAGTLRR